MLTTISTLSGWSSELRKAEVDLKQHDVSNEIGEIDDGIESHDAYPAEAKVEAGSCEVVN